MVCSVTTEYARKGIDTAFLENDHLRVEVLTGKGGDVTEIRDKRTDTNVLFEAPHEWVAPNRNYVGAPDGSFTFMDHYPGGWQDVLPAAGGPTNVAGAPLGLHGESSLTSWDADIISETDERVRLRLTTSLTRYPLKAVRELSLTEGESRLQVQETVINRGEVEVDYSWLQHIALGRPLLSPNGRLDVPCNTVVTDPDLGPNAQVPPGERFDWPLVETEDRQVDLRKFPPKDERVHDLVALTDFDEGRYTVTNPDIDLGTTVRFPTEIFEYVWFWRALGGFEEAPFFGRNYNVGLEPATSIPNSGLSDAIENETAERLDPGERVEAEMTFETHAVE